MSTTHEKTTLIGHCQVCEREIRCSLGRIAHHGYERPGDGWQTASCMGALEPPFEQGHDALDRYLESIEAQLAALKRTHAKYEAQRLPIPNVAHSSWLLGGRYGKEPPTQFEPDDPQYEDRRRRYLEHLDQQIRMMRNHVEHHRQRRATWKLQDLERISEEIERKSAAEREARKAEVEAKRAERKTKADARAQVLKAKYAIPCEFAINEEGNTVYCWSHGVKCDARFYRHLPRRQMGKKCYRAESFERYGHE
jgi:hypothetical protein